MNNKEYFFAGLKAFSAQAFCGLVYLFCEPYIKYQFWVDLPPLIKFFAFVFIYFVPSEPFSRDFRKEMVRRRKLKELNERV